MINIGIYIYDEAEVLDFAGPFEVFSVASRFLEESKKFNVFLVNEENETVIARGGFSVNPSYNFSNNPRIDVLIVVGGVHTKEVKKNTVIAWIKETAKNTILTASVCTGAFLLAQAKIITNHKVTTHWEDIEGLKNDYPDLQVQENLRWVDEGNIVTSAGISAGIDMSLHMVSKLINDDLSIKTAKQMDFDWNRS
jgi:transcriptional regulator GlxA family with amidase domain